MRTRDYVRQKDSMQCGVACLAMVCRILGEHYSLEFLTGFCHATTEGVSLKGLKDAASRLGLDSMACRSSVGELTECPLPAILHWNQNHFVVLHRISRRGDRFHIADPGKGMYTLDKEMGHRHNNHNFHTADCGGVAATLPLFRRGDYTQPHILILHHP